MGTGSGGNKLGEHFGKGIALGFGNTIRDNLLEMMEIVPLTKSGYFGDKAKNTSSSRVRIVESSNPVKTAYEFQAKAIKGFISMRTITGKGYVVKLKDGTKISYRMISSSDGSPVVELTIKDLKRVKDQKIHFIKGDNNE